MDVGNGMLYAVSVVDGLVHQLGGIRLSMECKLIKSFRGGCPTGKAVSTSQGNEALQKVYDGIIHTAPPFYAHDENPIEALQSCYRSSFDIAFDGAVRVACPLIGAGARGFPVTEATHIAASESLAWRDTEDTEGDENREKAIVFGIPDLSIAENLVQSLESKNQYK